MTFTFYQQELKLQSGISEKETMRIGNERKSTKKKVYQELPLNGIVFAFFQMQEELENARFDVIMCLEILR